MVTKRLENAVVIGAGSAGLMAAVALRRLLPELTVRVVYDPNTPVIGVGESTTTYVPTFLHEILGLDRAQFFRAGQTRFGNSESGFEWGQAGAGPLQLPLRKFDDGPGSDASKIVSLLLHGRRGRRRPLFRLDGPQSSALRRPRREADRHHHGTAYHINNPKFLSYLRAKAEEFGGRVLRPVKWSERKKTAREISDHVKLDDGQEIPGDLFFGLRRVQITPSERPL